MILAVLVEGEWAIDAERTLYRSRPGSDVWLRGCEMPISGDMLFLHLPLALRFFPSRAVECPRCERQRYDVGDCALCGSVGWLDGRARPLRPHAPPSLPPLLEKEAHA